MDVANFRELDSILKPYGYRLKTAHPFFLPENVAKEYDCDVTIRRIGKLRSGSLRETYCYETGITDHTGYLGTGKGSVLWNEYVKSGIAAGSGKCGI